MIASLRGRGGRRVEGGERKRRGACGHGQPQPCLSAAHPQPCLSGAHPPVLRRWTWDPLDPASGI
eukprot:2171618-Rhodomonas_salina.1